MQLDFNHVLSIVRTCVNAGRADLIEDGLFDRLSLSELRAKIEAEGAAHPAAATTTAPAAASRSSFGEPTAGERDVLAAVLQKRFAAMYPKSDG